MAKISINTWEAGAETPDVGPDNDYEVVDLDIEIAGRYFSISGTYNSEGDELIVSFFEKLPGAEDPDTVIEVFTTSALTGAAFIPYGSMDDAPSTD